VFRSSASGAGRPSSMAPSRESRTLARSSTDARARNPRPTIRPPAIAATRAPALCGRGSEHDERRHRCVEVRHHCEAVEIIRYPCSCRSPGPFRDSCFDVGTRASRMRTADIIRGRGRFRKAVIPRLRCGGMALAPVGPLDNLLESMLTQLKQRVKSLYTCIDHHLESRVACLAVNHH
jgi:hypothetical protein